MTQPATDGNLPAALTHLRNAIHQLIDSKPETVFLDDGNTRIEWLDSLYTQLVEALPGEKRHRTGVSTSQPPMWIGALDQLNKIDQIVTSWEPHWPIPKPSTWPWAYDDEYPTIQRLRILEQRRWRPQDCSKIDDYTAHIQVWCAKIHDLLNETPKLTLPNPCPACNTKIVYRPDPDGGRPLRTPALKISAQGCTCQHCNHTWSPEYFTHLALVLGYEKPVGVLE